MKGRRTLQAQIEFLRANFRNDGAEGEAVNAVCDAVDALRRAREETEAKYRDLFEKVRRFMDPKKGGTEIVKALKALRLATHPKSTPEELEF